MTGWRPPPDAPCVDAHTRGVNFFPEADAPGDDDGRAAKAICAACPDRWLCLSASVARNEKYGIWGGAGGAMRRALRRSFGTPDWQRAVEAFFRRLDGEDPLPGDDELLTVAGEEMRHGTRARFAKGCRCDACAAAASLEGALHAAGRDRNPTANNDTWIRGGRP